MGADRANGSFLNTDVCVVDAGGDNCDDSGSYFYRRINNHSTVVL